MMNNNLQERKIKLALVGCGRISKNHFAAINHHQQDLSLVAVCDADQQVLDQAIAQQKVEGYRSLDEMLKYADFDVLTICTPSGLHATQTIAAAQAGKAVITEKPMATTWQDGLAMVNSCEQACVPLFVVKQNRLNAPLQRLKHAIDTGRFGRIYMVSINVFWTRPQSYYDQAAWRGTWDQDGGAFMNQASHYVDLLHWLIGPVEQIHAMNGTLARNIETEDSGVLNIRWRSGALGSMSVTMLTYPKNLEGSITILGEHGAVKVGGVAVNQIEHWQFAEPIPEDATAMDSNYQTASVYGFGHPLYYQNVIKTLRGEAAPETDGRDGLQSLELLIAAYRSARDNCVVTLPLER